MFCELHLSSETFEFRSPTEVRRWLSTAMPFLPPQMFNRDEQSVNLQTRSPFAIHPSFGGIKIAAAGQVAAGVLLGLMGQIQTALMAAAPDGEINCRNGTMGVDLSPRLLSYVVHDFVLENNASRNRIYSRHKAGELADLVPLAEGLFRDAVNARCDLLGLDLPDEGIFGDFEARPAPHACHAGAKPLFAVELRFRSNIVFKGPWYFGRLSNKGCGRLLPYRGRPQKPEEVS